jgi:DNA repair exonuclease SbcCD ATPase subunit
MKLLEDKNQNHAVLAERVKLLEQEIEVLEKELYQQLELREKELQELQKWEERYELLERRYNALRTSFLGKVTIKYWNLRKRIGKKSSR